MTHPIPYRAQRMRQAVDEMRRALDRYDAACDQDVADVRATLRWMDSASFRMRVVAERFAAFLERWG